MKTHLTPESQGARGQFSEAALARAFALLERLGALALIASLPLVVAQPIITTQPVNATAPLEDAAQFTVTGSGTGPLSYQWRFERQSLAGATNRTLNISNVLLSNLGIYEVVLTDSSGSVTSAPAILRLASRWKKLVIFGASNETPQCGGLAWPAYVANRLGVPLENYAGRGLGIREQITSYLGSNTPTTNTLIGHWGGGSYISLRFGSSPAEAAATRLANMRLLMEAGARNFLMPTLWPPQMNLGLAAAFPNFTEEQVIEFDAGVSEGLKALRAEFDLKLYRPDTFLFFVAMLENPAAFGITRPSGTRGPFVCDNGHFTSEVQDLMSQQLYPSLTPPTRIDSILNVTGGSLAIQWTGGSPPFRVESMPDLLSNQWRAIGETSFLPSFTIKQQSPHQFFRIVSLGQ